jgi:hypothetical protein
VATERTSTVHNWYFDFFDGATVCRVRGVKPGENTETLVVERGVGRYIGDDTFVVESEVESESGVHLLSGTTHWQKAGDHFEAEIKVGGSLYRGVLHINQAGEAVMEMFTDTILMNRGEFHVQGGTLYGRTNIYDAGGKIVTVCNLECKRANQPTEPTAAGGRGSP